jgi:hypothetical protein
LLESLPAASQSAVKLHDRECFVFLGDGQIELRRVVGVVGEPFKVAGRAAVVAKSCQLAACLPADRHSRVHKDVLDERD